MGHQILTDFINRESFIVSHSNSNVHGQNADKVLTIQADYKNVCTLDSDRFPNEIFDFEYC